MDGRSFEEIIQILVNENSPLPVCLDEEGNPDEACISIVQGTYVFKDFDSITNITLVSHDKIINLHTPKKKPPESKKLLRKHSKSVFDSAQDCYNYRGKTREKVTNTIFKVHKDCQEACTDKATIKFHHLKIYDKQGVFKLSKFHYDFEYNYGQQLGHFSKQTRPSGPSGVIEDDFTLFYQSIIACRSIAKLSKTCNSSGWFICKYRVFTLHPYGIRNTNKNLQPSPDCMHYKAKDWYIEEEEEEEEEKIT